MYQVVATAIQSVVGTTLHVSISETDDTGRTYNLASLSTLCADQYDALERYSLEECLEQMVTGLVNTLSSNAPRL